MDLFLIIFLTLLNGVFAMSEMAIASSRKARLDAMSAERVDERLAPGPVSAGRLTDGLLRSVVGEEPGDEPLKHVTHPPRTDGEASLDPVCRIRVARGDGDSEVRAESLSH